MDRLQRLLTDLRLDHALPVKRVAELLAWVRDGEYDRIVGGDYLRRGQERPAREEAGEAAAHYSERFRSFFREAGDQVATAGQRLDEWLRRHDDGPPGGGPDRP